MDAEMQVVDNAPEESTSLLDSSKTLRGILIGVLLVAALLCAIPGGNYFSSPEAYKGTIASLDEKRNVVTGLMTLSIATSTAITAIPDDIGTPIAERLVNLSEDFLIILTAIYLEKFLLTTFGFAAFRILIPIGCLLGIAAILMVGRAGTRSVVGRIAAKVVLFAVVIAVVVPVSIFISDKMEETHSVSLASMLEEVEGSAAETEDAAATSTEDATANGQEEGAQKEGNVLQRLFSGASNFIDSTASAVATSLDKTKDKALHLLSTLTDSLALLIITSCIIPILVLLIFLWLVKILLGVNVDQAVGFIKPRVIGGTKRFK